MNKLLFKNLTIASFSFGLISPVNSAIITIPLNYTAQTGDTGTLTGSFTINTTLDTNIDRNRDLGFVGSIPNWITAVTISYTDAVDSSANYTDSLSTGTISSMVWQVKTGATPDFTGDIVPDFDGLTFGGFNVGTGGNNSLLQDAGENEFFLTSTPSPLVALGLIPFLAYVKKFKKYKLD